MRSVRDFGRVWLAASVAVLLWLSTAIGGGLTSAQTGGQLASSQRALQQMVGRLAADGDPSATGQVVALLKSIQANQAQMATYNRQLQSDQDQLATLHSQLAGDRAALIELVSSAYVSGPSGNAAAEALASSNMTQFLEDSTLPQSIASQVGQLVENMVHDQSRLSHAQSQLISDESRTGAVEQQLGQQSSALLAQLTAPVATAVISVPSASGGAGAWSFAFGNCTYWVSQQWAAQGWTIDWGGNADQWWGNAAAAGFAEGETPRVGAIVVWPAGAAGASWAGHVAYVTALNSDGTFEVSEMNYTAGFDRVDYRTVSVGDGYDGFIYPPAGAS